MRGRFVHFFPARLVAWAFAALLLSGCALIPFGREAPRPGRTTLNSPLIVLPTQPLGNYLIIEAKWDRAGPYHFLVDTGSSVTLVTPEFAKRYRGDIAQLPRTPQVPVRSADGGTALLPATIIRRIMLGDARFEDVPALIYDCQSVSAHLGIKIDGILGFPLFRETILTLDYLHSRVVLNPVATAPLLPGVTIPFNNENRIPLIPIELGASSFIALVDSGRDAALRLNPVGLDIKYAELPRPGGIVSTLTGDTTQAVGRLADTITIGAYHIERSLIEVTDEVSAIGGGILKNFTVTFDQEHNRVTFYRDQPGPITFGPQRSVGLSFSKSDVYWRVVGIVASSPDDTVGAAPGDLVTKIDGEPVAKWDFGRYEKLVASADTIRFTFLHGTREEDRELKVFNLVP